MRRRLRPHLNHVDQIVELEHVWKIRKKKKTETGRTQETEKVGKASSLHESDFHLSFSSLALKRRWMLSSGRVNGPQLARHPVGYHDVHRERKKGERNV
ncbi:hypothetical protein TNCV_4500761 [Trichonephila clavipes]|nr:hypothetical protein TNCV_4500761 [Trichonephila clavipes]